MGFAFGAWRLAAAGPYDWTHDEGAYIAAAWMVNHDYRLYAETMTSSPPLFIDSLAMLMGVFGPSVVVARWAVTGYVTLGFIAVGLVAKQLGGSLPGSLPRCSCSWSRLFSTGLCGRSPRCLPCA